MDGQTIVQLLAAILALSFALAAFWPFRRQITRLDPLAIIFLCAVALWALAALVISISAELPIFQGLVPAINLILIGAQFVLVSTIFLLAFLSPEDQNANRGLLPTLVSLFAAAGLVGILFFDNSTFPDLSQLNGLVLPLAAFLSSASVLRILLRRRFWEQPSSLLLLVSAGAAAVYAMQSIATSGSPSVYASSLLLVTLAAAGSGILRMRSAPSRSQSVAEMVAAPDGIDLGHSRSRETGEPSVLEDLSEVVNQLPEMLFGTTDGRANRHNSLGAIGSQLQAARVTLYVNEINAQGLLCLSLKDSWADAGLESRREDPRLQRLPYSLSTLADWEKSLALGEAVRLEFDSPQRNDTLVCPETRSILLLPIQVHHDWLGLLALEHFDHAYRWSHREQRLLLNAARLLGLAHIQSENAKSNHRADGPEVQNLLDKARSQNAALKEQVAQHENVGQEAQKRLKQLQALNETSNVLLSTLDLETLLGRVLDAACQAIPAAERGTLHLIAPETGQLEMRAVLGFSDPRIQKHHSRARRGLLDTVINRKEPLLIEDLEKLNGLAKNTRIGVEADTRSVIAAPLIADQSVYGALYLAAARPGAFDEADLHLVSGFATTATLAIRNAQMHEKVQKMAITDQLTGLYNRRGFIEFGERLFESARRFHHSLAIIAMDIDYFKAVNDTHGHIAGDIVLQQLSEIVLRKIRKVDLVGRIGGDEFTILLPETDVFQAMQVAERLRKRVETSQLTTGRGYVNVTISLGVSRISTQTGSLEILMDWADQALYDSKQAGRNRVRMHPLEAPMPDLLPPEAPAN